MLYLTDAFSQINNLIHLLVTRTFVGTNLNPLWYKFLFPSEDDAIQCQHTASPLGNGAVVETSDKKLLVLQRSYNVGEFPGHFVFPGGHPEPQDAGLESHQCRNDSKDSELINEKVSQEMFDSIIREVVEEIGVPAVSLCDPLFIGVSRRQLNVRPAAFFFIKCSLESKEIQQLYSSAQDGFESTQLYTVSMVDLENMVSNMPGCHQGGFALYRLMVDTLKNT
ncbi:nudix hydrolase 9-like [Pistacia vera]|uniref:nudix hydrolase 9-like n=1 Tax=Pistacia vera TaxID=55513 RepID=UPI00126340AA|nr:nudix hydrolase 9-like [Pistacia vera]